MHQYEKYVILNANPNSENPSVLQYVRPDLLIIMFDSNFWVFDDVNVSLPIPDPAFTCHENTHVELFLLPRRGSVYLWLQCKTQSHYTF